MLPICSGHILFTSITGYLCSARTKLKDIIDDVNLRVSEHGSCFRLDHDYRIPYKSSGRYLSRWVGSSDSRTSEKSIPGLLYYGGLNITEVNF